MIDSGETFDTWAGEAGHEVPCVIGQDDADPVGAIPLRWIISPLVRAVKAGRQTLSWRSAAERELCLRLALTSVSWYRARAAAEPSWVAFRARGKYPGHGRRVAAVVVGPGAHLITNLALPGVLTDADGQLVFFNEAAAVLLGRRFEEVGRLPREEWARQIGPFDDQGRPVALDALPIANTLRSGRPAQGRFHLRLAGQELCEMEVSALPLVEPNFLEGVLLVFWPVELAAPGS